jgi:hypothetical protein
MALGFLGSISHTVGQLALACGDHDEAVRYLRSALETHRRLRFTALAAATEDLLAAES